MPEAFKLYPRGFYGQELPPQFVQRNSAMQARMSRTQVRVNVFQPQVNTLDANPTISNLYEVWVGEGASVNTFDFREKVMVAAIAAFGTESFRDWYEVQKASPMFGDTHTSYLEDTLTFIETGTRRMSMQNWLDLVTQKDTGVKSQTVGPVAAEFFGIPMPGARYRTAKNTGLLPVLQKWVSHPGGFEDLLLSLRLFFGEL